MQWRVRTVAASAMLAFACVQLAFSETKPAEEQASALSIVRLIKAAETDYFRSHGRYATLTELIKSKQLAQTAMGGPENLHAYTRLNLESEFEPVPGFRLGLDVPEDGATYKLALERPIKCRVGVRADEKRAEYEDVSNDCTSETLADAENSSATAGADIDHAMLPAHPNVPCPLTEVLDAVSDRAGELEVNLQKFAARELIEHLEIGKNGKQRSATKTVFDYVAEIFESDGGAYINEYRSQTSASPSPHLPLADNGTAAFGLLFLPHNRDEFAITCEGLTDLGTRAVWQLRFVQRADRRNDFRAYRINNHLYPVNIKGRAWVAADTCEVLRLESDLVEPVKEIQLQREHLVIDYAPVAFRKRNVRLWLPDNVTLSIEYRGHRYERRHHFSAFQLFSVDTVQETEAPLSDKDVQKD